VRAYHGNRAGLRHHLLDGLQLRLLHVALPRTNISWHVAAKRCCAMLASKHARKQARRLASPASWPVCRPTSNQHNGQTACPPASARPPARLFLSDCQLPPARLPLSACPPARLSSGKIVGLPTRHPASRPAGQQAACYLALGYVVPCYLLHCYVGPCCIEPWCIAPCYLAP
jgi:hypothetical protein